MAAGFLARRLVPDGHGGTVEVPEPVPNVDPALLGVSSLPMAQFDKGDIVTLKSGGPNMTVRNKFGADSFMCEWFDVQGQHHEKSFRGDLLVLVSGGDRGDRW